MIIIWPFMYGLFISILAVIVYFGPLAKERRSGVFIHSERVIQALTVVILISTYLTADAYVSSLNYLQNPPPYWVEDPPTFLFGLYFTSTCLPLFVTTILLLVTFFHQHSSMTNRAQS